MEWVWPITGAILLVLETTKNKFMYANPNNLKLIQISQQKPIILSGVELAKIMNSKEHQTNSKEFSIQSCILHNYYVTITLLIFRLVQ